MQQKNLIAVSMLVVGRLSRERTVFPKSSLVSDASVVQRTTEDDIDNLLHWQGQEAKTNGQPPVLPREASFSDVKGN